MQDAARRYIEINTKSQFRNLQQADFILCLDPSLNGRFPELKKGTLAHPDKGATVFYMPDNLAGSPNAKTMELKLAGPGIKGIQTVYVSGLDPGEPEHWAQHKNDYPMGIDIYLVDRSGNVIGIPRSVKIETSGGR